MQSSYWHPQPSYYSYPPHEPHSPNSSLATPTSAYDEQRYPQQQYEQPSYTVPHAEYAHPKPTNTTYTYYEPEFEYPPQPELSPVTPTYPAHSSHTAAPPPPPTNADELYNNILLQDDSAAVFYAPQAQGPSQPQPTPAMVGEQYTEQGINDTNAFDSFNLLGVNLVTRRGGRTGSRGAVNTNPSTRLDGQAQGESREEDGCPEAGPSSNSNSAGTASSGLACEVESGSPSSRSDERRPSVASIPTSPLELPSSTHFNHHPTSAIPYPIQRQPEPSTVYGPPGPTPTAAPTLAHPLPHRPLIVERQRITIPNGPPPPPASSFPRPQHTAQRMVPSHPHPHRQMIGPQGPLRLTVRPRSNYNDYPYPSPVYAGPGAAGPSSYPPPPPPPQPSHTHHYSPSSAPAQPTARTTQIASLPPHRPPPPPAHTTHPPPRPATPEHKLTETHNIPAEELDRYFRPAESNEAGLAGALGAGRSGNGRKTWVCPECKRHVRKQDRASHKLGHEGKKRYDCRCGKKFGRPQDADRHIREQAQCKGCDGKIGRYGKDGKCSTCVLEEEQGIRAR